MLNNKPKCRYCGSDSHIHIHTDAETYAINGFPDDKEAQEMFDKIKIRRRYAWQENI